MKVCLENLSGQIDGNRDRAKHRLTYLMTLSKWLMEQRLGETAKYKIY